MKLEQFKDTENWFSYQSFYDDVCSKYDIRRVVECGVWKGHSITYLAKLLAGKSDVALYAVDIWQDWDLHKDNERINKQIPYIYDIYNLNVRAAGVRNMIVDLRYKSWEAAETFQDNDLDMVFIDADHSYESVIKDIDAWLPKVKVGGILAGHDYFNSNEVKRAVNEKLTNITTNGASNTWMIIK